MRSGISIICILSSFISTQSLPALSAPGQYPQSVCNDAADWQPARIVRCQNLDSDLNSTLAASLPVSQLTAAHPSIPADEMKYRSSVVTGNGYGFAVISPAGEMTKFYTHPFRFESPNPDQTKDGPNTPNLVDRLTWNGKTKSSSKPNVSFLNESHILHLKKDGVDQYFFMPFALHHNVLIAMHMVENDKERDLSTTLQPAWHNKVEEEHSEQVVGRPVRLIRFKDVKDRLAIVSLDKDSKSEDDSANLHSDALAFVVYENNDQLQNAVSELDQWQNKQSALDLMNSELKSHEDWRTNTQVHFTSDKEHRLWRQSETILRMAQIREENNDHRYNHGLILASLPEGVWFIPWVRDMAYSLVSLTRMGHLPEAKEGLMAYFNARPMGRWRKETRDLDYQISVTRYYGDGSEESDYSGQQSPNVEFDDWGLALWACSEYWQKTHDKEWLNTKTYRGSVYESMRDFVVHPLLGNLDPYDGGLIVGMDSSLWEEHQQNKKHYASSTMACITGLRGFLPIADAMGDTATVKLVTEKLALMEKGFQSAFVHDGVLRGTVEPSFKNEIDGCVVEAINWNLVTDPDVIKKTIDKMELLKTVSGGYRRMRGKTSYEVQEFLHGQLLSRARSLQTWTRCGSSSHSKSNGRQSVYR